MTINFTKEELQTLHFLLYQIYAQYGMTEKEEKILDKIEEKLDK
jgi:hypothetical protein